MTARARAVSDAFKELTEYERTVAYLEIEKAWLAPYTGPWPAPVEASEGDLPTDRRMGDP
jgi:hypothetical protein